MWLFFLIRMKLLTFAIGMVGLVLILAFCEGPDDMILNSLGDYDDYEYYSEGEFQDYTDYAKYYYSDIDLSGNDNFVIVEDYNMARINQHLDNFEEWIEIYRSRDTSCEIVENYDFDRSIIDGEDYIHIYSEEHTLSDGYTTLINYDVYFFDAQTEILYYFHNNI